MGERQTKQKEGITGIHLKEKQRQELVQLKRKTGSNLIRDRAHAVLLRNEKRTIHDTARALLRSEEFVKQAIRRYKQGELEEVKTSSNHYKLSKEQRQEVLEMIWQESPKELEGLGYQTQFWSSEILKEVIKKRYEIEYKTQKSYYDLFKEAGFSFHKPKTKDFRQDPEKVKAFKGALKKNSTNTRIWLSW